jgi:orotate phosphoribosyltransferase
MEQYKKDFIEFMVDCGVLTFGDFTTKSGRKTPFFVNTGNYKNGKQLSKLGEFYAEAIKENFGHNFNILFGPAYKGIPLSVTTAISLNNIYDINVGYCSNRKEVKDHGDKGILLGSKIKSGDKVVIIEDVTTAGTSIHETMPIIKAQGDVDVIGLIISVDRMEKGKGTKSALTEIKEEFNMKTCAIVTIEDVVSHLYNKEIGGKILIDQKMKKKIEKYYDIYGVE